MTDSADMEYKNIPVGLQRQFAVKITPEMVDQFVRLTGDRHLLHTDPEYARKAGYDGIIVQGMLTSAYASTLIGMYLPGTRALILSQSFRYLKPVCPGEEISIRGTVKKKIDAFSTIEIDVEIVDSGGDCVSRGTVRVKVRD
jgi:3-hydroxybutyryl-CoA dehydratase